MNDVARQAGVGVATVDRVLNRRAPVASETAQRVLDAAQAVGFHGTALLRQRLADSGEERTLGFLLQRSGQSFYQALGHQLAQATRSCPSIRGRPIVHYLDDLTPSVVATRLGALSAKVDALAVVAADHPKVAAAVERARDAGVPVFTLLSDLSTPARSGFVGLDHRKAGRTAAWAIARMSRPPGSVGIFVGSHRYLGQDLTETSFRSYFHEHAPAFRLLESITSLEDPRFAQEATHNLLDRNSDLVGLHVAGGGIEGVIEALRERSDARKIVLVCNELVRETRAALIDGVVDLVIGTPLALLADRAVEAMVASLKHPNDAVITVPLLPFDLYLSENI